MSGVCVCVQPPSGSPKAQHCLLSALLERVKCRSCLGWHRKKKKKQGRLPHPGSNLVNARLLEWKDGSLNVCASTKAQSNFFYLPRYIHKVFLCVRVYTGQQDKQLLWSSDAQSESGWVFEMWPIPVTVKTSFWKAERVPEPKIRGLIFTQTLMLNIHHQCFPDCLVGLIEATNRRQKGQEEWRCYSSMDDMYHSASLPV